MKYINWYEKDGVLHTGDGKEITVLKLNSQNDDEILDELNFWFSFDESIYVNELSDVMQMDIIDLLFGANGDSNEK